jgi:hypothetical protein
VAVGLASHLVQHLRQQHPSLQTPPQHLLQVVRHFRLAPLQPRHLLEEVEVVLHLPLVHPHHQLRQRPRPSLLHHLELALVLELDQHLHLLRQRVVLARHLHRQQVVLDQLLLHLLQLQEVSALVMPVSLLHRLRQHQLEHLALARPEPLPTLQQVGLVLQLQQLRPREGLVVLAMHPNRQQQHRQRQLEHLALEQPHLLQLCPALPLQRQHREGLVQLPLVVRLHPLPWEARHPVVQEVLALVLEEQTKHPGHRNDEFSRLAVHRVHENNEACRLVWRNMISIAILTKDIPRAGETSGDMAYL